MEYQPRKYTSASEINCLLDNPSAWLLSYKYGYKSSGSPAMQRGLDVEYCLVETLKGNEVDVDSILCDVGMHMYNSGLHTVQELGCNAIFPKKGQWKVEYTPFRTYSLPVIGYLDLFVPSSPIYRPHIIDIKTTSRAPSIFPAAHARQAAIYQSAFIDTYDEISQICFKMPMLHGQLLDAYYPHVTFIYLCSRKTNPVVVFTTDYDLKLSKIKSDMVQYVDLSEAYDEFISAYRIVYRHRTTALSELRETIPINTDHYRFSGYDDEILKQFKCNTLEPHNSEL